VARIVVIGGGFGGLAAAIRVQAQGHQVTLLEKLERVGGRAGQIREAGFTFDTGPSIITAPHLLESLWQAAGRRLHDDVDLVPLHPYYRIEFADGERFDYGDATLAEREVARCGGGGDRDAGRPRQRRAAAGRREGAG
jgi:phytoene desaturase